MINAKLEDAIGALTGFTCIGRAVMSNPAAEESRAMLPTVQGFNFQELILVTIFLSFCGKSLVRHEVRSSPASHLSDNSLLLCASKKCRCDDHRQRPQREKSQRIPPRHRYGANLEVNQNGNRNRY